MHIQIPALAKTLQLTKESLFVDVGGYIGDFTKHVLLNFDCKVLLFEPYIPYFEKCQKRFRNDTRVIVLPLGLGNVGSRIIYEHKEGTSLFQDWHNIQDENKIRFAHIITPRFLDKFDISALKLNCEGAEYEIIQDIDLNKIPKLLVEFHPIKNNTYGEVVELLNRTHAQLKLSTRWELWERKF